MSDDIRAPVLWRRPNARTYTYNQVDKETELQRIRTCSISDVWRQLLPAHDQLHRHKEQAGRGLFLGGLVPPLYVAGYVCLLQKF